MSISVLIAEDHGPLLSAIRRLLENEPGIVVVAEADDVPTASFAVERLQPDVVLMDAHMPGAQVGEAIEMIHDRAAEAAVIVMSACDDAQFARSLIRGGADGFVAKQDLYRRLVATIRAARRRSSGRLVSQA